MYLRFREPIEHWKYFKYMTLVNKASQSGAEMLLICGL